MTVDNQKTQLQYYLQRKFYRYDFEPTPTKDLRGSTFFVKAINKFLLTEHIQFTNQVGLGELRYDDLTIGQQRQFKAGYNRKPVVFTGSPEGIFKVNKQEYVFIKITPQIYACNIITPFRICPNLTIIG